MVYRSYVFFFKQKTAYEMRISDWSSDVCSSDLHDDDEGRHPQADSEQGGDGDDRDEPLLAPRPEIAHRHQALEGGEHRREAPSAEQLGERGIEERKSVV